MSIYFTRFVGNAAATPIIILAIVFLAFSAKAALNHTAGFTRYARVDRTDGTYREMLVNNAALAAVKAGRPLPADTTILMETYYSPDQLSTIFAEQYDGVAWRYGSMSAGDPLPFFRNDVSCSSCHQVAAATETIFTLPLVERFAESGQIQRTTCDRSGRTPCEPHVYLEPNE